MSRTIFKRPHIQETTRALPVSIDHTLYDWSHIGIIIFHTEADEFDEFKMNQLC